MKEKKRREYVRCFNLLGGDMSTLWLRFLNIRVIYFCKQVVVLTALNSVSFSLCVWLHDSVFVLHIAHCKTKIKGLACDYEFIFVCVYLNVSVARRMPVYVCHRAPVCKLKHKEPIESLHETPIRSNRSYFQSSLSLWAHIAVRILVTFNHYNLHLLSCSSFSALIDYINDWLQDYVSCIN